MAWLTRWHEEAQEWCAGRSWIVRAPLLLYLAYVWWRHLVNPLYQSFFFGAILLGTHELGHVILSWAPRFLTVAGGTLAELAAPMAAAFVFYRQRDFFGIAVAAFWLSFGLFETATYMADAREYALPYVSVGGGELEAQDWDHMFSALGILEYDKHFAFLARVLAFTTGLAAIAGGAWLLRSMATSTLSGARN